MEPFLLPPTDTTPEIKIDYTNALVSFHGISIPEDPIHFFTPIQDNIDLIDTSKGITFDISLEYFNTSSSKVLLDILIDAEKKHTTNAKVIWRFEQDDEEIEEEGITLETISNIPFEYISFTD